MNPIIETVLFKLQADTSSETFVQAAHAMETWLKQQPGFVRRRLSSTDDHQWIDHIEWHTLEAAQQAANKLGKEPQLQPFMALIDESSVTMLHSQLRVSIN